MKSFKSKKSKALLTCLAVVMIVSILCLTLAGCKKPLAGETPLGVYFVGDFQKDVAAEDLAKITKEGEKIYGIEYALAQAGIDKDKEPAKAAAAIYATAVTNYNNITQTGYYVLTDAKVSARGALAGKDVNVGIRSTYSSFTGKNGSFSQTVSGVTQLDGIGPVGDTLRGNFGYNIQSFNNDTFSAFRRGSNGGAQFPTEANDKNVYKYILGAYNSSLSKVVRGDKLDIKPADKAATEPDLPEYVPAAGAKYADNSTLKGKLLPEFNPNRNAWEPLNRIPARQWVYTKDGKRTDKVEEIYNVVEGTRYSCGTYGAGFAVYDFSRPEYLSNDTVVSYNSDLDLWTVEVKILKEYVDQACEFAAGDLIKDTKSYIGLKDASFTKIEVKIEVYGSGLIKSMQKRDELSTNKECPLTILPPNKCTKGGVTSNTATMAFSYSDNDTDANRLAALYWPELGENSIFKNKKVSTSLKLDLSGYDKMSTYEPKVNETLMASFNNIFAKKK
ncbi:MAG: hypothetical protein K2M75_02375 [Clostridia bacterium]|nr:hypothetical protein [Clostridia bacterium]